MPCIGFGEAETGVGVAHGVREKSRLRKQPHPTGLRPATLRASFARLDPRRGRDKNSLEIPGSRSRAPGMTLSLLQIFERQGLKPQRQIGLEMQRSDHLAHRQPRHIGERVREPSKTKNYLSLIGGADFSAGAGGSAGVAPDFSA
jgi:hypothetical protein